MASSDQIIQQARTKRREQVKECSKNAAQKIMQRMKGAKAAKLNATTMADLIAESFEEMIG